MKILFAFVILLIFLPNFLYPEQSENKPELLPAGRYTLDSIISANKGKIVLINLWAEWCEPCKEEIPSLLKLNENLSGSNFKIIFITIDNDTALLAKTLGYLSKNNVNLTTYYNNFEKDEDLINYMTKTEWDGGIPGTFIYDSTGKQQKILIGKKTYEEFEEAVKSLL